MNIWPLVIITLTKYNATILRNVCHKIKQQEFVNKNRGSQFANFRVDYKQGAPPTLVLQEKSGAEQTVAIDSWKENELFSFLGKKLQQ